MIGSVLAMGVIGVTAYGTNRLIKYVRLLMTGVDG